LARARQIAEEYVGRVSGADANVGLAIFAVSQLAKMPRQF